MPYWRLSGLYLFYFGVLGALVPYWGLYLQSIGFAPADIGNLIALIMVTRIVAPNLWAWIADHRERRMQVVRVSTFLTLVAFAGVYFGTTFWWLALVMLVFSFFWHASLPLLEVFVMNHTAHQPGAYGRVRLWGSIGFILAVVALGPAIDAAGPAIVVPSILALMLGLWLASLTLPESETRGHAAPPQPLRQVLLQPPVLAFLAACFLMQLSHGPYYTFYTIYLETYGYSKTLIGLLWAFAVVCEIAIFLWMARLLRRFDLGTVLAASFALAAVRWVLIGFFPQHLAVLWAAQALHAATFGTFHAAGMQMVHRFFTGKHQHRGQAIYGTASFGVGGALGSFYAGHTWTALGPTLTYVIAAASAALAWAIAWRWLRPKTA